MAGNSVYLNGSTGINPGSYLSGIMNSGRSPLGLGLKGFIPQQYITSDNSYEDYEYDRYQLVQAWNTTYPSQLKSSNVHRAIGPFRAVNNSGDLLSRQSYSSGGSCMTFQSRPGMHGLRTKWGAVQHMTDGTDVPSANCNPKYVYDSSNYIRYKKQDAIAKTFNNLSNGGDQSSASQSALRHIRRY